MKLENQDKKDPYFPEKLWTMYYTFIHITFHAKILKMKQWNLVYVKSVSEYHVILTKDITNHLNLLLKNKLDHSKTRIKENFINS